MSYINSYKDQNWLLPLSIKQMIPENLKFLEEEQLEGYIPNVPQAQKYWGKPQTVQQDDYEYD